MNMWTPEKPGGTIFGDCRRYTHTHRIVIHRKEATWPLVDINSDLEFNAMRSPVLRSFPCTSWCPDVVLSPSVTRL
jgi:hypothetical protein